VLVTKALSLAGAGTLELNNTALVVDYAPATTGTLASVRQAIFQGYGRHGGNHLHRRPRLGCPGIRRGCRRAGLTGNQTAPFLGQTVDATSVLVRFTLAGDANLDGAVDFLDLAAWPEYKPTLSPTSPGCGAAVTSTRRGHRLPGPGPLPRTTHTALPTSPSRLPHQASSTTLAAAFDTSGTRACDAPRNRDLRSTHRQTTTTRRP